MSSTTASLPQKPRFRTNRSSQKASTITIYTSNPIDPSDPPIKVERVEVENNTTSSASSSTMLPVTPPTSSFTSLRRSTRSQASNTSTPVKIELVEELASIDETSPKTPRKRVKREPLDAVDGAGALFTGAVELGRDDVKPQTPQTPRSAKKAMPLPAREKAHPAPLNWEEQYRLIDKMRQGIVAPVDNMGCERPRLVTEASPKTLRFHILISLMLSSQTKDPVTSQAVTNLHHTLPGGLTAQSLSDAPLEMVQECINKVGFWRRKTEYIQEAAKKLLEQDGEMKGDVPDTIDGLCALKGVGPKMAFLALQCAWNINAGIGVDVHVHRITNRLKWHKPQSQTPEQTRVNLESWLPSHLHKSINPMLVGFGQMICLPVGPRCDICLLGKARKCPSRIANVNTEGRKPVIYTFEDEGVELIKPEPDADNPETEGVEGMPTKRRRKVKLEIGYESVNVGGEGLVKMEPELELELESKEEEPGLESVSGVVDVLNVVDAV